MQFGHWLKSFDWKLFALVLAILLLGCFTFYLIDPDDHQLALKQLLFVGIGAVLMVVVSLFDYRIFKNTPYTSLIFYFVTMLILGITLFSSEIRGARSWINIFGLQFEPTEIVKLALLILMAKYFSRKHIEIYRANHVFISGLYTLVPAGITFFQSDLGSMMVLVGIWISMLLFSGINKKHLLAILMIGVIIISISWFLVLKPYQKDRLLSFVDPYLDPYGSGYHTIQSRITLGSGQWTGTFMSGREETTPVLVPEPYTDFVFAAYAQKYGFLGVVVLLTLIVLIMVRIGSIAANTNNNFSKLYCLGFMSIIVVHILINAGMNLGLFPITGIPFPFLSHGGSFLLTLMIGLGLIQSIKIRNV